MTIPLIQAGCRRTTIALDHDEAMADFGDGMPSSHELGWDDLAHRVRAHVERGDAYGVRGLAGPPPDFTRELPW